jgi:NADPH:quinone reductase-like Zn-dependent oxidoreductase
MRAVVQDVYGGPETLALVDDLPRPQVSGPQDVLVRVRAAGVDPSVWHLMTGTPLPARLAFGLRAPRTRVRGWDVSGVVEAVGSGVTRFSVGDAVFGSTPAGSYAEYVCAAEKSLALAPSSADLALAAALPVSGMTALQGFARAGGVSPSSAVLVIGAGGGVGSMAVQLAKAEGARVVGVCSSGKAEFVRSLGADDVVDYRKTEVTALPDRYDVVVDTAGNRSVKSLRRILAPKGSLVIVGAEVPGLMGGMGRPFRAALLSPFVGQRFVWLFATTRATDLDRLRELVDAGALRPPVTRRYPLAEVPQAIHDLRGGRIEGKAIVDVSPA